MLWVSRRLTLSRWEMQIFDSGMGERSMNVKQECVWMLLGSLPFYITRCEGRGHLPFPQPLCGSFPHQHPVGPCTGAAGRWIHVAAELSCALSSVSPAIPVPDTEARPFISGWFVLGETAWSESFAQPLPSPQLCWRGSCRLTLLKIPRPLETRASRPSLPLPG